MLKQIYFKQFYLAFVGCLNIKTHLFQVIQFSMSTQFSSIWPIERALSGTIIPGQSEPGSNGNKGILRIF